jgi:hypothetical protein
LEIDKYLRIDRDSFRTKGYGDITLAIPATILNDPEKCKKLKEEIE